MKTTACSCTEILSRARLIMMMCRAVVLGVGTLAMACSNAGAQGVMKTAPAPNRNIALAGPQAHRPPSGRALPGKVEGFVYWDTHTVTHNPAGDCSGFSASVIAGGNVLAAASNQFGAKYVGQVKAFLANGTVEVYDVCTYAYDNLPENAPLRVELNVTQSGAFLPAAAPTTAIVGPLTIINAHCNMLPNIANPTVADLQAKYPGSCQDMAFDVNFQLAPASAASRAIMLQPRTGTLLQSAPSAAGGAAGSTAGGTLLNPGTQTTVLGGSQVGTKPVGGTSGVITGGTKNADDLNPQPYPPKGTSRVNNGATSGISGARSSIAEQQLTAALAKPPVPGKAIKIRAKTNAVSGNATILAALQKQRQAADVESAQMKLGIRPQGQSGMIGQQSQVMSANGGGPAPGTQPTGSPSQGLSAAQTGNNSSGSGGASGSASKISSSFAKAGFYGHTSIIECVNDPTMRIASVSGSSYPATFTPIDQYNLYTIRGCSFGTQAPTSSQSPTEWVHLYGGTGSFDGKFVIRFWSDNEIDVSLDESITGFPDMDNLNLVVKRADGQQTQKGGFKFYAVRATVPLQAIPQSWVTLAPFPSSWNTGYSSPPASPSYPPVYPKPAIAPPGPSAGSAYVSRSVDGEKYTSLDGVTDYYDFSQLAPGWTTDSFEVDPYDQYCPSGGGWTVTYKKSFGTWSGNWDGNNIRIGLSDTTCSGFTSLLAGLDNYQNWSGSYYALEVWVSGPRGTDPLTGKPVR